MFVKYFWLTYIDKTCSYIHRIPKICKLSRMNSYLKIHLLIYVKKKVKLAAVVKSNQRTPFSWARHRGAGDGDTPFPGLLHFTLDMYQILLSKKASSTIFKVFGMMGAGIEPRSPGPLANTLPMRPMSWFLLKHKKIIMTSYVLNVSS